MINFALLYSPWQDCQPLLSLRLLPSIYSATASLHTCSVLCECCCFDCVPQPPPSTGHLCQVPLHGPDGPSRVSSKFSPTSHPLPSALHYPWFLETPPVSRSTFPTSWFHPMLIVVASVVLSTIQMCLWASATQSQIFVPSLDDVQGCQFILELDLRRQSPAVIFLFWLLLTCGHVCPAQILLRWAASSHFQKQVFNIFVALW